MPAIQILGLWKSYGGQAVLHNLNLSIQEGRITAIMGPSGCGKTTLLRVLMGLEKADLGQVVGIDGMKLSAVFQEDRLCEHLTATQNIRIVHPRITEKTLTALLAGFGLGDCIGRSVRELSGGMRRRVALCRALAVESDLLLMDEPFKGLDDKTKEIVIEQVSLLRKQRTLLFVTHSREEAEALRANIFQMEDINTVESSS